MKIEKRIFNEKTLGKESFSATHNGSNPKGGRDLVNQSSLSPVLQKTINLNGLVQAAHECRRNIAWKDSVLGFGANLIVNLLEIRHELIDGTYKLRPYKCFTIHEPKTREIVATAHRDRVVQRAFCNAYFYEAVTKHFIYDNAANQKGKGTDFARKRLKAQLHRWWKRYGMEGWVVQFDVKSFFRQYQPRTYQEGFEELHIRFIRASHLRFGNRLLRRCWNWPWFGNEPNTRVGESQWPRSLHKGKASCRSLCPIYGRWARDIPHQRRSEESVAIHQGRAIQMRFDRIREENPNISSRSAHRIPWMEVHPSTEWKNRPKASQGQDEEATAKATQAIPGWSSVANDIRKSQLHGLFVETRRHAQRDSVAN